MLYGRVLVITELVVVSRAVMEQRLSRIWNSNCTMRNLLLVCAAETCAALLDARQTEARAIDLKMGKPASLMDRLVGSETSGSSSRRAVALWMRMCEETWRKHQGAKCRYSLDR